MSVDTVIKFLEAAGKYGPWALCVLILYWAVGVLLDEDKAALIRAKIYKALYHFTGRTDQEKKYIANDVRGRLNLARRQLCPSGTVPPEAVEVVWVEGGVGNADDIKEGEFIVRLDPSTRQERNIVMLATAVVKKTTMAGIRHSVELPLQTAIDLNVIRQLLMKVNNKTALDWFLTTEYEPATTADSRTRHRNDQVLALDERGLFTRVLLIELEDFARRVYGKPPRPYMAGEVEGLVQFLYRIASKEFGQDVPLQYFTAFIRIAFVLVAKTSKVLQSTAPYVRAVQTSLQQEPYSVYILAFDKDWLGEKNPEEEKRFQEQVERLQIQVENRTVANQDFNVEYSCLDPSGKRRKARCIRYVTPFE